jgi:chromosome segregation ATPase
LLLSLFIGVENENSDLYSSIPPASPEAIQKYKQLLDRVNEFETTLANKIIQNKSFVKGDPQSKLHYLELINNEINKANVIIKNTNFTPAALADVDALNRKNDNLNKELASLKKTEEEINSENSKLEKEVQLLKEQILKLEQTKNDIWLIPENTRTSKSPLIIIANPDHFELKTLESKTSLKGNDIKTLLKDFSSLDKYVVFYIKPTLFDKSKDFIDEAKALNFEVGYEPINEDQQISFKPDIQ